MPPVLVLKLGALGDLLLADGALRDLRLHHPQQRIVLLTRRAFVPLMQRCPWVDAVEADENAPRWKLLRMRTLARRLRAHGFALAYDLQGSRRSAFYRRWLLPGVRWAAETAPRHARPPVLERHAALLAEAGVPAVHTRAPHPAWLVGELPAAVRAQLPARYVVLLPGSSARHVARRWPGYRALAMQLAREGIACVCVPGPDELDALRDFPAPLLLDDGRCLGLPALAAVLQGAAFVVGNDSGPTHLAAHLGCHGLALHGPGGPPPETTGILREGFDALRAPVLADITVDAVASRVHVALHATPETAPVAR